MPITGGLSYATPTNNYVGAPIDEVKALNLAKAQEYDLNKAGVDHLDVLANSLDLRSVDAELKKQIIDDVKSKFSKLTADGDYQNAGRLVNQVSNDFKKNNALKDAINQRQKEVQYFSDLKKRLDEGKITPDEYKYGIISTRQNNNKPTSYNEELMTSENPFSGHNVVDNKTKDIYDTVYKRIADWKASSAPMDINGRSVRYDQGKGLIIDAVTAKEVPYSEVYNALKTEVQNEFSPFLEQERKVNNFKKFYNSQTGQVEAPSRDDIPLVDDDIRTLMTGLSQKDLEDLEKAAKDPKNKGAKLAFEKAKEARDNVDLNNYNDIYHAYDQKSQLDKYVSGAANKAAYMEEDHHFQADEEAKLALQHKYKKAEIDYEQNQTLALPETTSQLENFSIQDYENSIKESKNIDVKLNEAKNRLEAAKKSGNNVYIKNAEQEVHNLTFLNETAKSKQIDFVKKLSEKSPEVAQEYFIQNITNVIEEVKNNPSKYSPALRGELAKIEGMANRDFRDATSETDNSGFFPGSTGIISNGKDVKSVLKRNTRQEIQTLYNQIQKEANKDKLLGLAISSTNSNYDKVPAKILDAIDEAKQKNPEGVSYQSTILGFDPNSDKAWERDIIDRTRNLVLNSAGNWRVGDKSLDEIVSNEVEGFEFKNEKNETVKPDLSKSLMFPQYNNGSGLNTVRIILKDSLGNPIYKDGDKKSQAAFTITPEDQQGLQTTYEALSNKLIASDDRAAKIQGHSIDGYSRFAKDLRPIKPSMMQPGEKQNTIINTKEGTFDLQIVKAPKGVNGIEVYFKDPSTDTYKPFILTDFSGKTSNTFSGFEQFEQLASFNKY